MTSRYETTELCKQIRRIESIPTSANTFTDADLTELMNMELQSSVVPLIQRVREEYFVVSKDYTIDLTTKTLDIPPEAIGMRVRNVAYVDSNGILTFIPRISPEELTYDRAIYGYLLQNNQIIFYTTVNPSQTVRITYFKRPNDLTTTEFGVIMSKDGANTLTLSHIPADWAPGTELDLINKSVPFIAKDFIWSLTSKTATTIVVPADIYALAEVGDYVTTSGMAPVLQYIPVEAHHLVVQAAAVRCLEALGDGDGWKIASETYNNRAADLIAIINPRVESQHKKIVSRNNIITAARRG